MFFNGQDIEKLYYHKTIRNEIEEIKGFKKFKRYLDDDDDEPYDSPEEDDEVNDFYYLKRKEDNIAELVMKNFHELSSTVSFSILKYLTFLF